MACAIGQRHRGGGPRRFDHRDGAEGEQARLLAAERGSEFGFVAKDGEDKLADGGAVLRAGEAAAARPTVEHAIRRMAGAADGGENVDRRLKTGAGGHVAA